MRLRILVTLLLINCTVKAQNPNLPDCRSTAHLIYHHKSRALMLLDGYKIFPDSNQNNVWKWDGKIWKQLPASGPHARDLSAGALDTHTGNIIVFGGVGKGGYEKSKKDDCWSFDGTSWKEIKINSIDTRDHHEMVYASHLKAFVIYGGQNERRDFDSTTWLLKKDSVIPLNIAGPGARHHFAMAYDPVRKKVVLYGGGERARRNELWEFDGNKWMRIADSNNPGNRIWHSMVYSNELKMVVMHGGREETNGFTWGWNGQQWKKIAEGGPIGNLQALGYDPVRKAIVAYGGNDENGFVTSRLWELKDGKWKKVFRQRALGMGGWKTSAQTKLVYEDILELDGIKLSKV